MSCLTPPPFTPSHCWYLAQPMQLAVVQIVCPQWNLFRNNAIYAIIGNTNNAKLSIFSEIYFFVLLFDCHLCMQVTMVTMLVYCWVLMNNTFGKLPRCFDANLIMSWVTLIFGVNLFNQIFRLCKIFWQISCVPILELINNYHIGTFLSVRPWPTRSWTHIFK